MGPSIKLLAAITLLVILALPLNAEDKQTADENKARGAPSIGQIRADCAADRKQHCSSVKRSRLTACLIENRSSLASACRGHIDKLIVARQALQTCHSDVEKHCAKAGKRHSQIFGCLADNRDQLSETCQTGLAEARRALRN